jgi:hypothetical protein
MFLRRCASLGDVCPAIQATTNLFAAETALAVLRSRSRLVTFRLDPEEYAALRRVCISTGARSMSEFAREAVLAHVDAGTGARNSLGGDLVTLTARLQELDKLIRSASGLIGKVLGGGDGEEDAADAPRELGGGSGS